MTTTASARDRLATAALELFQERSYEQATIEDIAQRAGVGRATFFRHYRSKEDVIFPDHERLLGQVRQRLESSNQQTALAAVSDAVRLVLRHYVAEGELARTRYGLTSSVATLRDREIATVARYQRLFREFIAAWMGQDPDGPLRSELMAAAVVAAHNHVLRRWLRGESADPEADVDRALGHVLALFSGPGEGSPGMPAGSSAGVPAEAAARAGGSVVVAFSSDRDLEDILPALREALDQRDPVPSPASTAQVSPREPGGSRARRT